MTQSKQQRAAAKFAENWKGKGIEKSETQNFWRGLLSHVFGIADPETFIQFEKSVMVGHKKYIDAYIENTLVLIEQKSVDIDLRKKERQSDGEELTPYEQAKRYAYNLRRSEMPRWIITCNFKSFLVYDMEAENPEENPQEILLENLEKEFYRLAFIANKRNIFLEREEEISKEAGRLVGRLHKALEKQYSDSSDKKMQSSLNTLCVRLVFCLYAEDAGLFGKKSAFHDYMRTFNNENFRMGLIELFKVLDTQSEDRDPYLNDSLKMFPYVNGGLFKDESIVIPQFTDEIIEILLEECSAKFDWSEISPTIFGAVFESTLNPETRRGGGMHYTSVENIHKVIDPLFMNELKSEFNSIRNKYVREKDLKPKLFMFQQKLANLKFLDPACGSGNFLTESYISLRRLENKIVELLYHDMRFLDSEFISPIKVSLNQFFGIEINDFAVAVAKAAMWIAESQMQHETENIIDKDMEFFPLKDYAQIVEGNALKLDWFTLKASENMGTLFDTAYAYAENLNVYKASEDFGNLEVHDYAIEGGFYKELNVITKNLIEKKLTKKEKKSSIEYDYIMGNPPFVGFTYMTSEQKSDMQKHFPGIKNLDYVCAWYKKASDLVQGKNTKCAFVSTNSITQGETVARFFPALNVRYNFAYSTFVWDSESFEKAHVHCVIIGFSSKENETKEKFIIDENGNKKFVKNISPYLVEGSDTIIQSRNKPLCNVPKMVYGNKPADGGFLIIEEDAYDDFIRKEPDAKKFIRPFLGAAEFLYNKKRYCLWLVNTNPAEIRKCRRVYERVEKCKETREASIAEGIRKFASTPALFAQITQPEGADYILIPRVSSENRKYVPMSFLTSDTIVSDAVQIIPNATPYEFGVLTSSVHMAWMRAVCGRLEMRYRYSKDIVYNNFPWCKASSDQKVKIERTAQAILDVRALYPDCSLADLYDELTMPKKLRRAHADNDKEVMHAYGFSPKMSEDEVVAKLFRMYEMIAR